MISGFSLLSTGNSPSCVVFFTHHYLILSLLPRSFLLKRSVFYGLSDFRLHHGCLSFLSIISAHPTSTLSAPAQAEYVPQFWSPHTHTPVSCLPSTSIIPFTLNLFIPPSPYLIHIPTFISLGRTATSLRQVRFLALNLKL